jgi:hypothetical protein
MGGNVCKHARREVLEIICQDRGVFVTDKIVTIRCKDCLTGGQPTTVRAKIREDNITGVIYSFAVCNSITCQHSMVSVDRKTEKYACEETGVSLLLGMFTAGWIKPDKQYIVAVATCKECDRQFDIKCLCHKESKWENYKEITTEKLGTWEIIGPHHNTH